MFDVSLIILLCLLPQAKSGYCDRSNFVWKGNTVEAIDDCDILRTQMKIRFDWLTNKPSCLTQVKVKIYDTQSVFFYENLGIPGKPIVQIPNNVPKAERCGPTSVHISAQVCSGGCIEYTSVSLLISQMCTTASDVNFQKDCSGIKGHEPTTETPNQNGTNPLTGNTTLIF